MLLAAALAAAAGCTEASGPSPSAGAEPPSPTSSASGTTGPATPSPTSATSPTPSPSADTWTRQLDLSPEAVATDGDGDVYVTGFAPYGRTLDTGRRVAMVLEKVDPTGAPIWTRRWKSRDEMFTDAAGFDVAVSPGGDIVYVSGETLIPPWEARQVRLWAYSSGGELLWTRQTDLFAFGATIGATSSGAVAGGFGWLGGWSETGDPLWTASFEEPTGEHCDEVADIAIGGDDDVFAVGFLDTTPTCGSVEGGDFQDADVVIQRRSVSGDLVWSQILADPEVENDWARAIDVVGDEPYVAGNVDGRAWLARLTPDGELAWSRRWGAPDMAGWLAGISAAPWDAIYTLASRGPLIVRRYTPDGDLVWDRRVRPGLEASGLATGPDGAVYVIAGDHEASGELRRIAP